MERVSFCKGCGKLINAEWVFCPYCGSPMWKRESFESITEEPFRRLEEKAGLGIGERLELLEREIDTLERDLDTILEEWGHDSTGSARREKKL